MKAFVISLDFELLWGVMDSRGDEYHQQIRNVHRVIPELLSLFREFDIACTWATVGALCTETKADFDQVKPNLTPSYDNDTFNPYLAIDRLFGLDKELICAPNLVEKIVNEPKQELASHTFCHYYCLEKGQSLDEFKMDLQSNTVIAKRYDVSFKSLVFPRNQFNSDYLLACKASGLTSYRGNPEHKAYKAGSKGENKLPRRAYRLLDAYIPLSGTLRQKPTIDKVSGMVNVPASLFLRPWSRKLSLLEPIRLWRIKWSMTKTAKKGGIFHLWWHPHNFGTNSERNIDFLKKILIHYKLLNENYEFESLTMEGVALRVVAE